MLMQHSFWPEVEAYLKDKNTIIVPIGSTEQHGPTGLIGTDTLCAESIAEAVGETLGLMVGPAISVGMAQHHLAFPGSISLRPTTLIAVIKDYVQSLAQSGFSRFFFINGHGGNTASVKTAFSEIQADRSFGDGKATSIHCALVNWYEPEGVAKLRKEMFPEGEGSHATPSELALTWHLLPDLARTEALEPKIAPKGGFRDAADFRANFPDGRIGSDPSLATVKRGKALFEEAAKNIAAICREFSEELSDREPGSKGG